MWKIRLLFVAVCRMRNVVHGQNVVLPMGSVVFNPSIVANYLYSNVKRICNASRMGGNAARSAPVSPWSNVWQIKTVQLQMENAALQKKLNVNRYPRKDANRMFSVFLPMENAIQTNTFEGVYQNLEPIGTRGSVRNAPLLTNRNVQNLDAKYVSMAERWKLRQRRTRP